MGYPDGLVPRKTIVAGVVLTTALALVAAPGLAGSRTPAPYQPVPAAALQTLDIDANAGSTASIPAFDRAYDSAGRLGQDVVYTIPGVAKQAVVAAPPRAVKQAQPKPRAVARPAKYSLSGQATFYSNGTTAMRLPRGTVIRVCGKGGCIQRVVTDYGPKAGTGRIIDLYKPDFFRICGCASWSGVTNVKIYVYGVP
jgi:hypothetical protein